MVSAGNLPGIAEYEGFHGLTLDFNLARKSVFGALTQARICPISPFFPRETLHKNACYTGKFSKAFIPWHLFCYP